MSIRDSTRTETTEQVEKKDQTGNNVVSTIRIIERTYPCRPQVIERREKWVKFGRPQNFARGTNERGVLTVTGPTNFVTDEGEELNQEIEIAQNLIEMGKKHLMSKQLKM